MLARRFGQEQPRYQAERLAQEHPQTQLDFRASAAAGALARLSTNSSIDISGKGICSLKTMGMTFDLASKLPNPRRPHSDCACN